VLYGAQATVLSEGAWWVEVPVGPQGSDDLNCRGLLRSDRSKHFRVVEYMIHAKSSEKPTESHVTSTAELGLGLGILKPAAPERPLDCLGPFNWQTVPLDFSACIVFFLARLGGPPSWPSCAMLW
jgi:hypothetical protein